MCHSSDDVKVCIFQWLPTCKFSLASQVTCMSAPVSAWKASRACTMGFKGIALCLIPIPVTNAVSWHVMIAPQWKHEHISDWRADMNAYCPWVCCVHSKQQQLCVCLFLLTIYMTCILVRLPTLVSKVANFCLFKGDHRLTAVVWIRSATKLFNSLLPISLWLQISSLTWPCTTDLVATWYKSSVSTPNGLVKLLSATVWSRMLLSCLISKALNRHNERNCTALLVNVHHWHCLVILQMSKFWIYWLLFSAKMQHHIYIYFMLVAISSSLYLLK